MQNWQSYVLDSGAFIQRALRAARPAEFIAYRPATLADSIPPLQGDDDVSQLLLRVCTAIHKLGGRAFIVGGYVRDQLLGLSSKDYDVEVFGLSAEQLKGLLSAEGVVDIVGEQFGVLMLHGYDIDWSLPRTDSKQGRGHRGISVETDPHLSYAEAARRRDLTMNALMWDPLSGELIDPYQGLDDIKAGRLRAVDRDLFGDDPLRALRAVRMAAVYGFVPDQELFDIMREQDLSELSRERLWGEWEKICLKGRLPSLAFLCLEHSDLLRYFPEIDALRDVEQDPHWHPEGDVYIHTAMVMDAAVPLRNGERDHDLCLMLGALCHDLGKAPTTEFVDGRWRSKKHDTEGIPLTESFLTSINSPHKLIKKVAALVEHHLKPISLQKGNAKAAAYRRLARKCADQGTSLVMVAKVCEADHRGRTSDDANEDSIPYIQAFYDIINDLNLGSAAPEPIVQGRDLIALGHKPGPKLGKMLQACFDYQLESGETDRDVIIKRITV